MSIFKKESASEYVDLFGGVHYITPPIDKTIKSKRNVAVQPLGLQNIVTPLPISIDSILPYPEYTGGMPTGLLGFNECLRSDEYWRTVHFYIDDRRFIRILRNPEKYVGLLGKFASVIAPDFSIRVGMPEEEMLYSVAANRSGANYLHDRGVNVIPNIQWSVPSLYDECFSGIAIHSIVAVNCTGIIGCHASKFLWLQGYKEMLRRLDPACIIRYGDKMPGEDESRSIYFQNERLVRLRKGGEYGR